MLDRIRKYLFRSKEEEYKQAEENDEYVGIGAVCDSTRFNKLEQEALKDD